MYFSTEVELWILSPFTYIESALGRDVSVATMNRRNDYSNNTSTCSYGRLTIVSKPTSEVVNLCFGQPTAPLKTTFSFCLFFPKGVRRLPRSSRARERSGLRRPRSRLKENCKCHRQLRRSCPSMPELLLARSASACQSRDTFWPRPWDRSLALRVPGEGEAAAMECRVLSIQSHVVRGYVGNKSATFPLQVRAGRHSQEAPA